MNYLTQRTQSRGGAEGSSIGPTPRATSRDFFGNSRSGCPSWLPERLSPRKVRPGSLCEEPCAPSALLRASAPLRLCASAPLRLCASAPLRQVVQQGVPIQELIAKRTTIRERKSRTRKIDWPADPWMPRTDGPTKLAEPAFYAFVSIHPVNCWFALSRSGTGKATRVPYEPFLKNVPLGYALSCDRPY